ncbi:MAG: hypothetical protein QXX95_00030 [Nitrososphaerales archaeon]
MSLDPALEKKIKAYEIASIIAAIAVHFGVFINAFIVLAVLKLPLPSFFIIHVGLQIFTFLNAIFGAKIIRSYINFLNMHNMKFGKGIGRYVSSLLFKRN